MMCVVVGLESRWWCGVEFVRGGREQVALDLAMTPEMVFLLLLWWRGLGVAAGSGAFAPRICRNEIEGKKFGSGAHKDDG